MLRLLDYNYVWQDNVTLTASSASTDFPVSNLTSFHRSKVFRTSSIATAQTVLIDIGTTESIDSFVMLFDKINGCKLTPAAVVKIQANGTNNWSAPAVDVTLTFDDIYEGYTYFWTSAQTYRYWRVSVTDTTNPYGYIELSKIFLGYATQLTQDAEIGFGFEHIDLSTTQTTPYGHAYHDIYPILNRLDFKYKHLSEADCETLSQMYRRVGKTTPILVAIDPTEIVFNKDKYLLYGRITNNLSQEQTFYSYFDTGLSIQEVT